MRRIGMDLGALRRRSLPLARTVAALAVVLASLGSTQVAAGQEPADVDRFDAVRQQVRDTSPTTAELHGRSVASAAPRLLRCFDLGGPTYCLGIGFTDSKPSAAAISSQVGAEVVASGTGDEHGGAMSAAAFVAQRTKLTDKARIDAELAEIDVALAGAGKAREVRSQLSTATAAALPSNYIMYGYQTRQVRSYWCGPATFQSIDWADDKQQDTQQAWATDLGTTTSGTSITSIVSLTNSKTNWDIAAGPYITQSVASWTASQFLTVHRNHLGDEDPAPIIEHPKLLRTYFPYLKYNHSGHFTVGRGYATSNSSISYFEVFNEADWNSSGNTTWGVRAVPAATLLAATKANSSFQNIGM
jgi:hypothetical protein